VLTNSIRALEIDPEEETGFTNTLAALTASDRELNSPRRNPDARQVLVLLTDGLPTAADGTTDDLLREVTGASSQLRESGIEVYAIGLGSNVNRAFLEAVVADPAKAFLAPDRNQLEAIYRSITTDICEAGPAQIEVIVRNKANFEPLR
jgi:nitric oxide reductase activation protein